MSAAVFAVVAGALTAAAADTDNDENDNDNDIDNDDDVDDVVNGSNQSTLPSPQRREILNVTTSPSVQTNRSELPYW